MTSTMNGSNGHMNGCSNGVVKKRSESLYSQRYAFVAFALFGIISWNIIEKQAWVRSLTNGSFQNFYAMEPQLSMGISIIYILFVFTVGSARKPREPTEEDRQLDARLNGILRFWNLSLSLFSVWALVTFATGLWDTFKHYGYDFNRLVCDSDHYSYQGVRLLVITVFHISKYLEMIDTILLIIRRKPVIFLHWYHHFTVLLFSALAAKHRFPPSIFFGMINALVHTVMYFYYYRRACGVMVTYGRYITKLQITQMVLGLLLTANWSYLYYTDSTCKSENGDIMLTSASIMYGSYLVLFGQFYIGRFKRKKTTKKQE